MGVGLNVAANGKNVVSYLDGFFSGHSVCDEQPQKTKVAQLGNHSTLHTNIATMTLMGVCIIVYV